MEQLIEQIEAAIGGKNLLWLLKFNQNTGYFGHICTDDMTEVDDFESYKGYGSTPSEALSAAFAAYKASLS